MALFTFTSIVCFWALYNLTVYAALRASQRYCSYGLLVLGSLSLVLLFLCLGALALFVDMAKYGDGSASGSGSRDLLIVLGMSAALLLYLGCGGVMLRVATQKQMIWWHGVLFFALYTVISQSILTYFLNTHPQIMSGLDASFEKSLSSLSANSYFKNNFVYPLALLLVVASPFIAPISEAVFRSFWRAYQQNKNGSFA